MKMFKKLMTMLVAVLMVLTMTSKVKAEDDGQITVYNATYGQTYEAYLIFPGTPSDPDDLTKGIIYTATTAQIAVSGFGDVFDSFLDENGNYSIVKKSGVTDDAVIAFVVENLDDLKQGSAITGTYSNNSTYVFSGLAYGYYYVTSSLGSLVAIDTAGKNAVVVDKNESQPVTPSKVILTEISGLPDGPQMHGIGATERDASVASTIEYQVTFSAVNWVQEEDEQEAGSGDPDDKTQVYAWNFTDTAVGLDIDLDSLKVTVNETEVTVTDAAVDDNGVLTFSIPWVDNNGKSLYKAATEGSELIPVVVNYSATVNDDAATAVATNTVEVEYVDSKDKETSIGTATTKVYTYKFDVQKVDENGDPLEGAAFVLEYKGNVLSFTVVEGVYHYDPEGTVTKIQPVGTNATASIVGLDDFEFTLKEVVVPAGYAKAADTTVSGLTRVDSTGTVKTVTVENVKGTVLPTTGGIGTTIFHVAGALLVLGAGIVLISKKRANNN